MIRTLKVLVATLALSSVVGLTAHADPSGYYGGANIGLLNADLEGLDDGLTYGLRGGVAFDEHIAVGLNINLFQDDASFNDVKQESNITSFLAEAAYYFDITSRGFYVGPRLGYVMVSKDLEGTTDAGLPVDDSDSTGGLALGIFGGYSYVVSDQFTVSGDVGYSEVFADDSFSMIQAIVSGSYWF